jgi:aspartate/methionine/tyrosine aminotransferase
MFSRRLPPDLSPTPLARAVERARSRGGLLDLTESNPTRVGLEYPPLDDAFEAIDFVSYDPEPLGLRPAREAVSASYANRGVDVPPDRLMLTASSSESYAFLFKLLCDAGDNVLVPVPSYPLFEHLASLEGVVLRPYRLSCHGVWSLDADEIEARADARTRAVLLVSPNNPTGSRLRTAELHRLARFCSDRNLALVGDEVFADYPIEPAPGACASVLEQSDVLTFALGGLSKSAGMPHLKLGWTAIAGPPDEVAQAVARLELIADTYLSVSTLVQRAAPRLLEMGRRVAGQIAARIRANYAVLRQEALRCPSCDVPPVEGGWSAVVRVPATRPDDEWTLALLDRGVLVHPGYLFDFDRDGFLVVSLLVEPDRFRTAIARLFDTIGEG